MNDKTATPKIYRLKEQRLKANVQGYENTLWNAYIEAGVPFDEIIKPEFYAHVADGKGIKIGDEITAVCDDGSWRAHLYIIDVGRVWVRVHLLSKHELAVPLVFGDDPNLALYRIDFKGRLLKHSVVRNSDNEVIKGGFTTSADANVWLGEHLKAMGGTITKASAA